MSTLSFSARAYVQLRAALITKSLETVARLRHLAPDSRALRAACTIVRDLPYAVQDRAQRLDLYVPKQPRALVVYVHGRGFTMLSKHTHEGMAHRYVRMGYAVASLNYRLAPGHRYPTQLGDVVSALEFLVQHAATYGLPADRMVLAGESAGGNLVAALALAAALGGEEAFAQRMRALAPRICAVVSTYGYHDLAAGVAYARDRSRRLPGKRTLPSSAAGQLVRVARAYVHDDPEALSAASRYASPLQVLAACTQLPHPHAPVFVDCGTRDPLFQQSKHYAQLLQARGVACELLVVPGELHGYDAFAWRKAAQLKWQRVASFLDTRLPR
jgi:acetyl esterase